MANSSGSDDMLNRVMPRDNIGLAALLKTKETAWENCKSFQSIKYIYFIIFSSQFFPPLFIVEKKNYLCFMLLRESNDSLNENGSAEIEMYTWEKYIFIYGNL